MKKTSLRTIGALAALLLTATLPVAAQTVSTSGTATDTATATAAATTSEIKDGYFAVPGTGFMARLNLKPRMDIMADNRYAGSYDNSSTDSTSPYRFAAALIPVKGVDATYDNNAQIAFSGRSSVIAFDAQTLSGSPCDIAVHYDNDFYGHEYGGSNLYIRVNQVYVRVGNLILGQAVLPLEDGDMWFDSYDLCGPSGMIFARQPEIRYNFKFDQGFSAAAALNGPATDSSIVRAPDFTANVRWDNEKFGHVQLSGLASYLTADNASSTPDKKVRDTAFCWGVNLSLGVTISPNDTLQLQGTYGKGMFPYSNDWFVSGQYDFDATGKVKPLTYTAGLIGYSHKWSDKFRSTIGYSMTNLDNPQYDKGNNPNSFVTYHKTQYALANVIWTPVPRMDISLEVLYGSNQLQSGDKGNVTRVLLSVGYSLF